MDKEAMPQKVGDITIRPEEYEKPGLYLILKDSTRLELTRENIARVTEKYWADPEKIPSRVKDAVEFHRCPFCPLRKEEDFCDALRPILPLLDAVDKFSSYDEVVAIYRGEDKELLHVSETTMQRALRFVSTMSIIEYCQVGRKYLKYSIGIIPVLSATETANRMYLNIYWIHGGDEAKIDEVITRFREEISHTTRNQLKRLRLICDNDAFKNAFILTHLVTDLLLENRDRKLKEALEAIDARE